MDETKTTTPPTLVSTTLTPTNGSQSPPRAEVLEVSGELAARWLDLNTRNRPLNDLFIEELAGRMLRGEWQLNGEAIKLSYTDQILDGQHRLWALVKASEHDPEISITTFVIFGLEPEAQDTMDSGRKRTLADVLAMHKETNTMNLAATLNRLHLWEQGESALRYAGSKRLSATQALAKLELEPHIRDAVKVAARIRERLGHGLAVSLIASCLYRFDQLSPEDSLEFWRQVGGGEGLHRYDPAYELRQAISKNAARKQKLSQLVLHAFIIKAWNAYREGQQIRQLQWRAGGASPERFPEPV